MDPCGPQKKIKSNEYHVAWQKLLDNGGGDGSYGGGFAKGNTSGKSSKARDYNEWKGTVKGDTKHTYGVDGKNDPE